MKKIINGNLATNSEEINKIETPKAETPKVEMKPTKTRARKKQETPAQPADPVSVPVHRVGCVPDKNYCETIIVNATKADGGSLYASVPLSLMDIDPIYQRQHGPHIKKIAAEWDETKCGTLLVSYRNGRFYIVDGQHRAAAAAMRGVERLYCLIRTDWNRGDEAAAFAAQDIYKYRLNGLDKLKAKIAAGDPHALAVQRVCEKYRVTYRSVKSTDICVLRASERAMRIVAEHGEDMLEDIFEILSGTGWRLEKNAYSAYTLYALRNVLLSRSNRKDVAMRLAGSAKRYSFAETLILARSKYPADNNTDALTKLWKAML